MKVTPPPPPHPHSPLAETGDSGEATHQLNSNLPASENLPPHPAAIVPTPSDAPPPLLRNCKDARDSCDSCDPCVRPVSAAIGVSEALTGAPVYPACQRGGCHGLRPRRMLSVLHVCPSQRTC